jgi:hypothetical protein
MAHNQEARLVTKPQHQKSLFRRGTSLIKELHSELVVENRFSFLKRYAVFLPIGDRFSGIPLEINHEYIVRTL